MNVLALSGLVALLALLPAPPPAGDPTADVGAALRAAALADMGEGAERARAGRYEVYADPGGGLSDGLAGRLGAVLLSFDRAYRRLWAGADLPAPPGDAASGDPVAVYVLSDGRALDRVLSGLGTDRPPFERGGAFFPGSRAIVAAQESRLERVLVGTLLHEAAHLLNHEIFGGARLSPWLNEGLAQYCQYSLIRQDGEIRLGTLDPGSVLRVPQGEEEILYQFVPKRSLGYLIGQFKRDPGLSLGPLLDGRDPEAFYMNDAQLHYAQSWTLVHLLAEGSIRRVGPLRPYLTRYAEEERRGRGGRRTLLTTIGVPLEDLDSAWYRHVRRLW